MIKTFQWLYKLGYDRGRKEIIAQLYSAAQYHRQESELAFYRKDENPEPSERGFFELRMTAQEHAAASDALQREAGYIEEDIKYGK